MNLEMKKTAKKQFATEIMAMGQSMMKTVVDGDIELSATVGSFGRRNAEGSGSYSGDGWNVLTSLKRRLFDD